MSEHWEIDEGPVNSAVFFRALPEHFPEATTFYAEGTSIVSDVVDCYMRHSQAGEILPGANTIWPFSRKFRCGFTPQLFVELSALAERHAEPELLDHLFVYAGSEPLLEWHDAFANAMLLPYSLSEARVSAFAHILKLPYAKAKFR